MSRVISTTSAGKDRILIEKGIVKSIRELARQTSLDQTTKDLVAYIALSLLMIGDTIEVSVAAWEKRGYWVKADRYRMEWSWSARLGEELKQALLKGDWASIAGLVAKVAQKMNKINLAQKNRVGTPWVGSFDKLMSSKS